MAAMQENPGQNNSYDVFLSYAHEDKEQARQVFEALGRQGWSIFMDTEIHNGERWERVLKQQLARVACVLVLWSPAARASAWVLREAVSGADRQVLVQAVLDNESPPADFSELQASSLAGWDGRSDHAGFLKVLQAVAMKVGTDAALGYLRRPEPYEEITEDHLALTSTSWRLQGVKARQDYPYQIHLRLVGSKAALQRVENVVYYFDPAYGSNRPGFVDQILKAYVHVRTDWRDGFTVYELANGYSVVRAIVKVRGQGRTVKLSRLVDIMDAGPVLKTMYHTWLEADPSR